MVENGGWPDKGLATGDGPKSASVFKGNVQADGVVSHMKTRARIYGMVPLSFMG